MKKYDGMIAELRELLPEYLAQKQIKVGTQRTSRAIRCINPQHDDRHPSMRYDFRRNRLHCFSCGASYDLFEVIAMDYPDCASFPQQVRKACEIFGRAFPADFGRDGEPAARSGTRPALTAKPAPQVLPVPEPDAPDHTALVEAELAKWGAGGSYFAARGISKAVCERRRLYQTQERAVIPVFENGRCVCWCGRAVREDIQPRYRNSAGSMEIFGADYLRGEGEGGTLFVTESAFDALSAEECGWHAVGLCGVGNLRKLLTLCAENPAAANSYAFIAAGDRDEAGAKMNAALKEGLSQLGLSCGVLELPEGVKDLNELLVSDRAALAELLEEAAGADGRAYRATSAGNLVGALLDHSMRRASRQAVPTGFAGLDRVLDGGLYAGLHVIGAISSLGKTSFVLQIADHIAANGTDVLYFSLEMSRMELMAKSISRLTSELAAPTEKEDAFTARQVLRFDHGMGPERAALLNRAVEQYRRDAAGLFIREGVADIGAKEIRMEVREHIRLRGGRKPVVVVDYLQILRPDDARASDKQNTDRSVVELKRISRDFDVPVLAVSSFNRENYRSAVSMEAFKESGAVEYSSDVLFGMQLAGAGEPGFDVNAAKARSPRAVELVLLKNRCGIPYARASYYYDARFSRFTEGRTY